MYYNHSSMRKVHLVNRCVVYVYWIETVYVQNNLPTECSKPTIFTIYRKICLNVVIFHDEWVTKRKLTCTNYVIILEKKIFKRAHPKSKCLCSGSPRRHILGCGISFRPESQLAFHMYYVKKKITLTSINARTLMVHDLTVFQEAMYPGKAQQHRRAKVMFS